MANRLIVSYLPDPEQHPLWEGIRELLKPAISDGVDVLDPNELVWIAFDGPILFGAGTTVLMLDGEARILACGGFEHKRWIDQAEAMVSAWARDCGARRITMRGRMGWARYFRAFGWAASKRDGGQFDYSKEL